MNKSIRKMLIFICVILALVIIKIIWVSINMCDIGSFESEKDDILKRCNYLVEKIITPPNALINSMPESIGAQFQGEWAMYSCFMLSTSLENIASLYPETLEQAVHQIDRLIEIVMSPEMRQYDALRWGEDPLESLSGNNSHVSYLSILAWMIANYKAVGGSSKYDSTYDNICNAMNRRIMESPSLNIETYPGECIYVPDMLVAIVSLHRYASFHNGKYESTVKNWLEKAKIEWIDSKTGLIASALPNGSFPIRGSYASLSCYYLTYIDAEFAKDQYTKLKQTFLQKNPATGIRELSDETCWLGFDIDAGPIILNLSPSGTAFAIGPSSFFGDSELRTKLLKTAEIAGSSWTWKNQKHYLLADLALVGEAITLAMRTSVSR